MVFDSSIVRIEDVSKRFIINRDRSIRGRVLSGGRHRGFNTEFWALKDINLEVPMGTTLGLVGHNGSGKSTLLKVIGGIVSPTTGQVWQRGRLAALLELGAGFHSDLTGRDNIFLNAAVLGMSRRETTNLFDDIVEFSGVEDFIDTQMKFYSSGMYVRLAFSVAVHSDPDLLLVDEVLAVGDAAFQRKCMGKIAEFQSDGRTIVLVSHSPGDIRRVCERVMVLESGLVTYEGDTDGGLRILRGQFAEPEAETSAAQGSPDPANGLTLVNADARVTLKAGEPSLEVVVNVELTKQHPTWGIELAINTATGVRVFTYDTVNAAVALPTTVGPHRVSFKLADFPLGAGTYSVGIAILGETKRVLQQETNAALFEVSTQGVGSGLVRLEPVVESV